MEKTVSRVERSRVWSAASVTGAILAAIASSVCCIGPLVFAVLGIGGGGLLLKLTPYRVPLATVTLALLASGFYFAYRRPKMAAVVDGSACECELPRASRVGRVMLWVAAIVVVGMLSFPYLAAYLFD